VDLLAHRRIPFAVGVVPAVETREGVATLDSEPGFVPSLRYAQQRRGRLLMRGDLGRITGGVGEGFWDLDLDRPPALDSPAHTRERLDKGVQAFVRHGLLPLGFQTPGYAASQTAYGVMAAIFSTALERVQLSDATRLETHVPSAPTVDGVGRLILPENLGTLAGGLADPEAVADFLSRARTLLRFRGAVAGCYFPADQSFDDFVRLVDVLQSLEAPFLDLASMSHWVRWPGGLLLTGESGRVVATGAGPLRWRAYDLEGRLTKEATEPDQPAGERLLTRRGVGAMELFEFKEYEP
jgi:hypothetical protein